MKTILLDCIKKEKPNAAALGAFNTAIASGATEKEAINAAKNAVSKEDPAFMNIFKGIAKKATDTQEFISEVRKIKNVPENVSDYFYRVYGENGRLDMFKAAEKFYKKYH